MRSSLSIAIVAFGGLLMLACGGSGSDGPAKGGGGTGGVGLSCETLVPAPEGCDDSCPNGSDSECMPGTHCLNGTCAAQCTATQGCAVGASCNVRGRCVGGTGGSGGTGNTGGGSVCGQLELATDRVIPNIMMIVDRSGSMDWDFSDCDPDDRNDPCVFMAPSRWDAVVDALVGENGLVGKLDAIARFGLTLYWKSTSVSDDGMMCAQTEGVAFSETLGATTDDIAATFASNNPGGYTPTAEAIQSVTASLDASPPPEGPTVYLLATDGQPNGCDRLEEDEDRNNSVGAVSAAFNGGVETFVLGVNFEDSHLQDLANAGQGVASGATLWTADSVEQLQTALAQIVEQNIPCTVKLTDGQIDIVQACEGRVTLNDEELACNSTTRGWQALDGTTIELMGSACDDWRGGSADLKAVFPCYVVVQ